MESWSLWQYFIYGIVPLAILVAIVKPGIFIKLRQKWLVFIFGVVRKFQGGHGHGHAHGNGHGHSHGHDPVEEAKRTEFAAMTALTKSKVPALKSKNAEPRILEIGVGPGANFQYYPARCSFIAVDPNPEFETYVKENLSKFPSINMERRLICGAEDMSEVEAGSVDAVIGTMVFCNIGNIQKAYKEIQRVLIPGGSFYFMDHTRDLEPSLKNYMFMLMDITRFSKLVFNATLYRNVGEDIQRAGFTEVKQKTVDRNGTRVVVGIATK